MLICNRPPSRVSSPLDGFERDWLDVWQTNDFSTAVVSFASGEAGCSQIGEEFRLEDGRSGDKQIRDADDAFLRLEADILKAWKWTRETFKDDDYACLAITRKKFIAKRSRNTLWAQLAQDAGGTGFFFKQTDVISTPQSMSTFLRI